ncbi:MAG: efflux RND transporter permease subunit [Bacteroidota bacterium]
MKTVGKHQFKIWAYTALSLVGLITLFFAFQLPKTQLDYNFEDFFPADDESTRFFYEHRAMFESDNDFLLIAVENESGVFDTTFLKQVDQLSTAIDSMEYVKFTRSITTEKEQFIYLNGATGKRPYINFENIDLARDSTNIYKNQELINTLINRHADAVAIFVRHEDLLSKAKSDSLVSAIQSSVNSYNFDNVKMAGRTVGQIFYINTMRGEMTFYVGLSMVLVVIFLLIAFRSMWGLLVPQIVIVGSMVWIVGFMAFVEEPLNILLIVMPSIMFVVSMSDVIHLVSKYFELLRQHLPKFEAIKIAFKEIGMATFLTSVTTAIGFFSLLFVNVKPIQTFGLYVGIGVLMAFVLTFSTLPFLFYFTKPPRIALHEDRNFWRPILIRSLLFTLRHRTRIPWIALIIIAIFAFGATFIVSNNYLMDDVDEDVSIKRDFNYFDNKFGGVRPIEISVRVKDTSSSVWDKKHLHQLETLQNYLVEDYGVQIKNALVRNIQILHRASNAGDTAQFTVPSKQRKVDQFKRMLKIANQGKFIRSFVDSTEQVTRISGTIPDWGNQKTQVKDRQLQQYIDSTFHQEIYDVRITGSAHLLDKNMRYMSTSLVEGLSFAVIVVAIIMGLLYRSTRMLLISIVPNIIPLIIIAGVMGYFGINLKITTAIVFTIAFGIAIDDTIHFLSKFKLELNKGKSKLYALKRTYLSTGKAITLTSLILISGFLLLLMSDFMGTYYMGLMVCITLFVAVIADLFLLPLLILYFFRQKEHPPRHKD